MASSKIKNANLISNSFIINFLLVFYCRFGHSVLWQSTGSSSGDLMAASNLAPVTWQACIAEWLATSLLQPILSTLKPAVSRAKYLVMSDRSFCERIWFALAMCAPATDRSCRPWRAFGAHKQPDKYHLISPLCFINEPHRRVRRFAEERKLIDLLLFEGVLDGQCARQAGRSVRSVETIPENLIGIRLKRELQIEKFVLTSNMSSSKTRLLMIYDIWLYAAGEALTGKPLLADH